MGSWLLAIYIRCVLHIRYCVASRGDAANKAIQLRSKQLPAGGTKKLVTFVDALHEACDSLLQLHPGPVDLRFPVIHRSHFPVIPPKLLLAGSQKCAVMEINGHQHISSASCQGGQIGFVVQCFHVKPI